MLGTFGHYPRVAGLQNNDLTSQMQFGAARPCTWAGGDVASTAEKLSKIL